MKNIKQLHAVSSYSGYYINIEADTTNAQIMEIGYNSQLPSLEIPASDTGELGNYDIVIHSNLLKVALV